MNEPVYENVRMDSEKHDKQFLEKNSFFLYIFETYSRIGASPPLNVPGSGSDLEQIRIQLYK